MLIDEIKTALEFLNLHDASDLVVDIKDAEKALASLGLDVHNPDFPAYYRGQAEDALALLFRHHSWDLIEKHFNDQFGDLHEKYQENDKALIAQCDEFESQLDEAREELRSVKLDLNLAQDALRNLREHNLARERERMLEQATQ